MVWSWILMVLFIIAAALAVLFGVFQELNRARRLQRPPGVRPGKKCPRCGCGRVGAYCSRCGMRID